MFFFLWWIISLNRKFIEPAEKSVQTDWISIFDWVSKYVPGKVMSTTWNKFMYGGTGFD